MTTPFFITVSLILKLQSQMQAEKKLLFIEVIILSLLHDSRLHGHNPTLWGCADE